MVGRCRGCSPLARRTPSLLTELSSLLFEHEAFQDFVVAGMNEPAPALSTCSRAPSSFQGGSRFPFAKANAPFHHLTRCYHPSVGRR